MNRVRTLVRKEWAEVFRQPLVLAAMLLPPVVFVALGTVALAAVGHAGKTEDLSKDGDTAHIREAVGALCEGLDDVQCISAWMGQLYLTLFLILPAILPVVFAAYSVAGEKVSRTLEPLLATPIATWELLAGKCLAAVLPALGGTWVAFGAFATIAAFVVDPTILRVVFSPGWMLAIFLASPLLAMLGVLVCVSVSSRMGDPRGAQQVAGFVVLPIVGLVVSEAAFFVAIDATLVVSACAVLALVDAALLWLAVQLFDREAILTRWK